MAEAPKLNFPTMEQALRDMKNLEHKYEASIIKLKRISSHVDKLKTEKQALKMELDSNRNTITYYHKILVDIMYKTENAVLSQNKAQLAGLSNLETIKLVEEKFTTHKALLNTFAAEVPQMSKLRSEQGNLLTEKVTFEGVVFANNKKMENLLNKFNDL